MVGYSSTALNGRFRSAPRRSEFGTGFPDSTHGNVADLLLSSPSYHLRPLKIALLSVAFASSPSSDQTMLPPSPFCLM